MPRRYPMNCAAHLVSVRSIAAAGLRVVGAAQLDDLAVRVFHDLTAGHKICITEPHLAPWSQAMEIARRVLGEILALDVQLSAERDSPDAGGGIVGVRVCSEFLTATDRVILDHQLERAQHRHAARRNA